MAALAFAAGDSAASAWALHNAHEIVAVGAGVGTGAGVGVGVGAGAGAVWTTTGVDVGWVSQALLARTATTAARITRRMMSQGEVGALTAASV